MAAKHIIEEANRCLQCKNPRCIKGCPVETPIKESIAMLLNGNILEAGEKLFLNNPLSVVCSLVCPHEKFCEGSCVLSNKGNPIQWSSIEHYISDYYLDKVDLKPNIDKNKKIAIIGSGPAGITISIILALKGYDITIFEMHDKIGGVLRYGIPGFRFPKDIVDRIKNQLIEIGVKIRPNITIGPVITIDDLFNDGYKAIFIGTGVWSPKPLRIKGESLGHVHYAIDYLKNPNVYNLGKKLCIIGAGNVAMDVARTALRKGVREVYIMYRKGAEEMSASENEIDYAKLDGVKFEYYKTPIEIVDEGIKYLKTSKVVKDEKVEFISDPSKEYLFESDSVIIAISQGPKANIVSNTKGISINNKGLVSTDEEGNTTREGVFASGDVVTGAKTVVEAVKFSKGVAEAIDEYVKEKYDI
ncbi:NAD(P)-dependent oxidoreductase [Clostridiisalibacter paucivorans]|uniref:NAD(P)-dependent oxidoreductase n=1 Tax=Clostridiisalibacter paucivorans TaxID=408753 RepID=UPI00047C28C8|nr:NAD(P)-dependent oxidoreductase [Clostridiisalibacter paucivorans]